MDEKKLAALHSHFTSVGVKLPSQSDFINSMKDERNAKDFFDTFDAQGAFDVDYDTFKSNYGIGATPTQPQTVVGNFMQSAQDLAAIALQEKAKSDARNEQIAGDIKSEQVRQKPKDYYTQNVPQVHAEFKQGEPQNLQAVMSPNNPKLPKEVLAEAEAPNIYEQAKPKTEIFAAEYKAPPIDENDPLQVGMQDYEAKQNRKAEIQRLLPNVKQETTLGFTVNAKNLANQIDADKVTNEGLEALRYAQESEIPNNVRDAIIAGDDKIVSDFLVKNKGSQGQTKLVKDIYNGAAQGSAYLGQIEADIPKFLYNVAALPQMLTARYLRSIGYADTADEIYTDADKFAATLGLPDNEISNYYTKEADKYQQKINQKYDKSITEYLKNGEIANAAKLTAVSIAQSAPITISLMMGNVAGVSTGASILGGGVAFGAGNMKEMENSDMPMEEKIGIAATKGIMEGTFEQVGLTKMGKVIGAAFKQLPKEAAQDFAKKTFLQAYSPILKKYLGNGAEESIQEMATQYAQNAVDKYSGYKPDLNIMEGVLDAGIVGFASSGVMTSPAFLAETKQAAQVREQAKQEQNQQIQPPQELQTSNEETPIPQQQEVPAQEVVQETPENPQEQVAQETPAVEAAELVQEAPEVEVAEVETPKTAEELDVRRAEIATRQGEIEPQLRAAKIEAEDLKKQLKVDYSDEIADKLDEKRLEIDVLEKEGLDLADEDTNIASQRETTLTEKETIDKRKAEIKAKTEENSANIQQLQAQYESAVDEGNRDLMKSLSAEKAALVAENESLAKEIESLQPKVEAKKESPANEKNTKVDKYDSDVDFEYKGKTYRQKKDGDIVEVENGKEFKAEFVTGDANKMLPIIYKARQKAATEKPVIQENRITETPIAETPKTEKEVVEKVENLQNMTTSEEGVTEKEKPKAKNIPIINKRGEVVGMHTVLISDKRTFIEDKDFKKEKTNPIEFEETASQETETPVAPAAPKEEDNKPEKGKKRVLPPKPQKPTTLKEPTTIKPVKSGSELAEMLGNNEQAQETGKVWDKVAETWAKKTGKTIEDWWDRIESVQVGGKGQKGSVTFENDKFKVFLASDRDISTPVHELAHIFQTDLSAKEKATVVQWVNSARAKEGKKPYRVSDWGFAENETSRSISEYFAEGFVEWLKEGGKTTDKAMQSVFSKFKEWLKDVVNTVFDAKVELNPEMRKLYESIFTEKEKEVVVEKKHEDNKAKIAQKMIEIEGQNRANISEQKADFLNQLADTNNTNTLFQSSPEEQAYYQQLEDWIANNADIDEVKNNSQEERVLFFDEIAGDVGDTVANEIIDKAFERILTPTTEAETLENELEAARQEKRATAEELIEIDEFRTKVLADLPTNATQEQFAEAKEKIEAKLEKSNLSEAEKKFIRSKVKERQFGAKFRDTYSQEMSKELRERVLGKTYFYNALSNDAAKTQAEIRLKGYYDTAIEEVGQKWYDNGKLTDENAKQVMADSAFMQEIMQATVSEALRNLDNIANIENYWEKVAATNYAIKAAGELEKSLRESGKESAANSIVDLVEMAVEKLARTGTALGRAVNMFGLYANMGANVAKAILMKQIESFNANLSDKQKALKETIESTVNDINNIVQDMANGKDNELLSRIMDAVAKNPKVEELLNEIMNRWESLDNEGQYKTILSEAYWAQREIDALNKEIEALKKQGEATTPIITALQERVIDLDKKLKNAQSRISQLKSEKDITARAEKQAKNEAEKATIIKAAKVKAAKTTTDAAFSRLRGYKNENTNTNFQRRVSGMAGNYNAKTIKDVNRLMETMVDEYYEVNTQHTIDGSYVANFNAYALAELATKQANPNLAIDPALYKDITDTIKANQFDQSVKDYTQDRIDRDYKNNMKKRVVGIMKDPTKALQPKTQKAEIRLALGELIMQAATAQTAEKQNIQQLIKDTFGITGANVNALATEFDKQFNEQVLAKQMQIAGKRMLTAQEQSKKTDEEIGKEYLKQLEKKGEKPFLENLAKDLRLSQGIGWSQDILDRMSNKYQMNIHSQSQKNELNRLFDIAEKAPEGTPKQKAMHDVMLQVIRMSYYGNLRKWEMTKHAIRHSNKLSGLSTQLSNIIDSVYKLIDLYVFKTALRTNYSGSHSIRVAAVTKALKGTAWKSAWNKFNLQEARLQGDFENIAEFFATNFAELPVELRRINNKESVGALRVLNAFAQFIQPLYVGKFKGDNSHSVATFIRGVMNFWDNVATESLKAGEQAVLLSQIDPTLNISNEMDIDMADSKQFNSGLTIGQIMADEIADSWYAADSREAFERKQELLSQYLQEKYGTEEVADDYTRAETYKKPPTGFVGMAYKKVSEVVRDANTINIKRIQEYEDKRRVAANKDVNKDLLWYKFVSMGTELANMFDYMRTQLNVLNMVMDRSIWLNAPRLLLNKSFIDTFSKANVDTYKKQFESIHDKDGKKLQTSSVEFVNIGSQIYEINKAEKVVDDKIKAHEEDARQKKDKITSKAISEWKTVSNNKTLDDATKLRKKKLIDNEETQGLYNVNKQLKAAITPLDIQKKVMNIQKKALVAGYIEAQTRIKDRLLHSAIVNIIGATIALLIGFGDDDEEDSLFDIVGDTQLKDVGSVQAMKNVNETKAVRRFIFRYGQLTGNVPNLGIKNTSQVSFAWGDTPYVFDFSIWASIVDAVKRVKYGKEEAFTPSNAADVVSQATLATLWQMGGQVGTQNLAEATDPKANLAWWERLMKVMGSSITFQVPAIVKHFVSDVAYGGQTYARNKDASDLNYLTANYFRIHGFHPRLGANYLAEAFGAEQPFIEQYSPVDGKPVLNWTNRDRLEVYRGIRGLYDLAKGNETKLRSLNQSGYKAEDVQDYLVFKGWLAKTGATTKITISNPKNIVPEYKDDKLAYLKPIPEKDFQEKIVKVAGTDIGIAMMVMYNSGKYLTKIPTPSEGSISNAIKEDIGSNGGLNKQELIEAVKSGEFDTKSEIYSYLAKSDEMAYKIGVQVIAKKVAKAERDKAIIEYLQARPEFLQKGESLEEIKERLEEK